MYSLPQFSKDAQWKPLQGGSINEVYRITDHGESFVVKVAQSDKHPGMFTAESAGLHCLRSYLNVPSVHSVQQHDGRVFLILEDLGNGMSMDNDETFFASLGEQLARMHSVQQHRYGLNHDNYIGSLTQSNNQHDNWSSFFQFERLNPLVKHAFDRGLLTKKHLARFDELYRHLPHLFPDEPPSMLHGDLWSGNVHCGENGKAYFIDPAVYVGHREMDIAMTSLFGGFSQAFYNAYNSVYPLEQGWQYRVPLCNLYPNLVHLILFGVAYLSGIEDGLKVVKYNMSR